MPKKFSVSDVWGKPNNTRTPDFPQKEDTERLTEMAAGQLAILLWETWLYNKKCRGKGEKDEKSS